MTASRTRLNDLIESVPHPRRWAIWSTISLLVKLLILWVLVSYGKVGLGDAGILGTTAGDTSGYFEPIESLLRGGNYAPDVRMPGYGVVYLLARSVSPIPRVFDILVALQLLLASVSMYLLARMVFRITASRSLFLLTLGVYAMTISVHWYDAVLLTESFATSAMILFLDRFLVWCRSGGGRALVLSGLWITWAIFLKPVLAPVPGIVLLGIWYARTNHPNYIRNSFAFLIPLIVMDGAWIVRNALEHGGIHPLTRTLFVSEVDPDPKLFASRFVIAFGGDMVWWADREAEVRFFNVGNDQVPGHTNATEVILPDRIMTSAYNSDSLRALSERILALKDPSLPDDLRSMETERINAKLEHYLTVFIAEHPFQYHVLSRIKALANFLKQSGNPAAYMATFGDLPIAWKGLKLFHMGLHYSTLFLGLAGAVFWWRSGRDRPFAVVATLIVPFGILIFPIGLRFSEHRYLVPFIPYLLLAAFVGFWCKYARRS